MLDLHKVYPQYCFNQHKGYPVPAHRAILQDLGPCSEHRFSYAPVKLAAEKHNFPIPSLPSSQTEVHAVVSPTSSPVKASTKSKTNGKSNKAVKANRTTKNYVTPPTSPVGPSAAMHSVTPTKLDELPQKSRGWLCSLQ